MQAKRKNSCSEIKKIDLIDFLRKLGYQPTRINHKEAWYYSPLKTKEKVASFRINIERQLWYDYSLGEGGDIIKLGCKLFNCSISELLDKLQNQSFSFRQPEVYINEGNRIVIDSIEEISKPELVNYIKQRAIDLNIAKTFCKQINYRASGIHFKSIGFINDSKGWELRSISFKGATKKDISTISNNNPCVCVFEGFFDTLSFIQLNKATYKENDLITLNSLSLMDKFLKISKKYVTVKLYLDNDDSGKRATSEIIGSGTNNCIDMSGEYSEFKDLNDFLKSCSQQKFQKPKRNLPIMKALE